MELKPGYKQTEIGVIPEDWIVKPLGELGQFKNGINKGKEDFGHGFPFINLMDVFGIPKVSTLTTEFGLVNTTTAEQDLYELKGGDVLFVRSSVKPEGVGLTALIPKDLPHTVFSGFLIRFRDSGLLELGFKEHCFWDKEFRARLISNSTVSANANINQDALKRLQIAFPPTETEQRSIATALSDMDELLGGLDRLIIKKRDLKQSAMQQLLTGKTRLSGFGEGKGYKQTELGLIPEDWVLTPLSKFSAFITKGSTPTTYGFNWTQDGILFLRSECVAENGLDLSQSMFISKQAHSTLKRSELRSGDLLITITGNVGRVVYLNKDFGIGNMNQHIARVRITDDRVCAKFIYHYLGQSTIRKAFNAITTGQAYPQISLKQVRDAVVPLSSIEEQNAIASILSDMDDEIATLEQRRNKTRDLKQAMMQELLTGRIRLL